jgi:hypothetical protein
MSSLVTQQRNDFVKAPNMARNARFHGWRHAQGLMHAGEVVMRLVQSNRVFVVLNLL